MRKGETAPGSVTARILDLLKARPGTASGIAAVLREPAHGVASLLSRMHDVGQVAVYYSVGHARQHGIQIETGGAKIVQDRAQVFGLPSATVAAKSRANGLRRFENAGLSHQIRELLADEPGLTLREVVERVERDLQSVQAALHYLTGKAKAVVCRGSGKIWRYYLYDKSSGRRPAEVDPERPFRIAGRIIVGRGALWGAGLA